MGRRAARATHLALWLLGALLYIVFVIPRWWVLTGDVPATAATFGRIVTGIPIAAAAVPVGLTLHRSLAEESRIPELALRLRAWSAVLHVIAGVLISATAIAEIWLSSQAAAPWLFGVYGGAGSLAVLAALAFMLSFPAEQPPPPPRPARIKPNKKSDTAPKQRRTRTRGRKQADQEPDPRAEEPDAETQTSDAQPAPPEADDPDAASTVEPAPDAAASAESASEAPADDEAEGEAAAEAEDDAVSPADGALAPEASSVDSGLGQPRPEGKKRHRLRR